MDCERKGEAGLYAVSVRCWIGRIVDVDERID